MDHEKILSLIEEQRSWRGQCLNMIASENIVSPAVREALASDFGHRYAEGLLGGRDEEGLQIFERFYQGTKFFDKIEASAMKLSENLFKAEHANLVPISGAIANLVAFHALGNYGDTVSGLSIQCGGHISHTHVSVAGLMGMKDIHYPFDDEEMNIDVEKAKRLVLEKRPKIMIFGGSLFLFPHPLREMREVADEIDAQVVYDGAHVAGLIAGKRFQEPFKEGADVMTSSTHKTIPGPQGGLILCKKHLAERIDNAAFPGLMSNHHLHHVVGFAIALAEMKKFGKEYARQIIRNSKALAEALHANGFKVLCEDKGFTESHQVVMDVSDVGGGQKIAENLEKGNIIANKNLLPWDTLRDTANPSGMRFGTQEITRIGMMEKEMEEIAGFVKRIAIKGEDPKKVRKDVAEFKEAYKEIKYSFD